jgi:hypothetical protein
MAKITQYGLSGLLICLAIGGYLGWLADRDTKLMNYLSNPSVESPYYGPGY